MGGRGSASMSGSRNARLQKVSDQIGVGDVRGGGANDRKIEVYKGKVNWSGDKGGWKTARAYRAAGNKPTLEDKQNRAEGEISFLRNLSNGLHNDAISAKTKDLQRAFIKQMSRIETTIKDIKKRGYHGQSYVDVP